MNRYDHLSTSPLRLDPFQRPAANRPGSGAIRRLFKTTYRCPMCRHNHTCESYVTIATTDLKDFENKAREAITTTSLALGPALNDARLMHQAQRGRPIPWSDEHQQQALNRTKVIRIEMTEEDDYTCNDCGETFHTIGEQNRHMGCDPDTGISLHDPALGPICERLRENST